MHDAWEARLPLGSRNRKGEREIFIDDADQSPWQPLARYAVTSGPIGVEIIEVSFDARGFIATPEDIGIRVATAEHLVPRGQIGADRGDTLELFMSPRITAALARDWRPESEDTRRLVVRFDFWGETHSEREELVIDLQPRLRRLDELTLEVVPSLSHMRLPAASGSGPADSIEVCELRAILPPKKRLLKGRVAHSTVRVDVTAAAESIRLLIGDSLVLLPDADDAGVSDQSAIRSTEGGWSFPQRSLLDVAFPARQRVGLDARVLNRRLSTISDLGAAGHIPVRIAVEHTLAIDSDDGTQSAHTGRGLVDVDVTYDLSPSFFLELPSPAPAVALFDKRDAAAAETPPRLTLPLPPLGDGTAAVDARAELELTMQLRLIGGSGGQTVQPWYHIDGVHQDYQPLAQAAFPSADPDRPIPPVTLRIPITTIVERFDATGQRAARVNIYLQRLTASPAETDNHAIALDVILERPRSGALLCIDWGASSIAAGITDDRNPDHVLTLPLGDIYRKAAGLGGRSLAAAQGVVLLDDEMPDLIPSRLSLSGHLNFRAAMSPFSYLDLRAGGNTDLAIARRVLALGRHYDIALPIPPVSLQSGDPEAAAILPPLKMLIAENRDKMVLPEPVVARAAAQRIVRTREISIPDVMLDCLDEIRGFYLTEAVRHFAVRDARRGADLERALAHGDLRLVLTHPCGLSRHLIGRYRDAGRRMLARLDRGLLPPLPGLTEPAPSPTQPDSAVTLVPESLAAAYVALRTEIERPGSRITDHPARLIALDFGAGTFDVSILDVSFRPRDIESWDIRCHYGVRIGGHDLDQALGRLADALLETLLGGRVDLEYVNPLASSEDASVTADQRLAASRFAAALEMAKRTLTRELFDRSAAGGDWAWADGHKLRIVVGRVGEAGWPVTARSPLQLGTAATLAGGRVSLVVSREIVAGNTRDQIVLEIDNIFSTRALEAFADAPRVRTALVDVIAIGELVSRRLPEASLAWLDARGRGPRDDAITCVSVTGRAALWPPIFEGFQRLAERRGAILLGSGDGSQRPPPIDPELMKKAVMLGAYHLARFSHFIDRPVPSAPLAIRFIPLVAQAGGQSGARRVVYLDEIVRDGTTGTLKGLDNSSLLQLSRVVPGLEELSDLPVRDGPVLWNDLLPSALNPINLSANRTLPEKIDIEVERGDDGEIRAVTFKAGQQTRCRIDDDGSTFIA